KVPVLSGFAIQRIRAVGDRVLVCEWGAFKAFNSAFTNIGMIYKTKENPTTSMLPNDACYYGGKYYVADNKQGLIMGTDSWSNERLKFPGPRYNYFYRMKWEKGKMAIANGNLIDIHSPTFNQTGGQYLKDGQWTFTSIDN